MGKTYLGVREANDGKSKGSALGKGELQRLEIHRKRRRLGIQLSIVNGYYLRPGKAHPKRQQGST